ncbi:MAG: hypothetical protein JSV22_07170 [Bacteroidales bacterium]|nr:MAG: hypothetical protein JSV22_07170 [Bacteroidales bacterium]
MKKIYPVALLILSGFLITTEYITANNQLKKLQFRHLTADDGLTSSSVNCILQDDKGFIWIGTDDGLNRYDGINFAGFRNDPADTNSLYDNLVLALKEDQEYNLLIGTAQGLSIYNKREDRFINYLTSKSSPLRGIVCTVRSIAVDYLDNLWLGTHIGLYYFDRQNNKIKEYTHDPDNPESISSSDIEYVFIDSRNNVWIGTHEGLNLFQPGTGIFRRFLNFGDNEDVMADNFFKYIIEDRYGDLWFGTYGYGLYWLPHDKVENGNFINYRHNPNDNRGISADRIISLFEDENGEIWVGTENHGIDIFDRTKRIFRHFRSLEFDPFPLNDKSIQFMFRDKTNVLWIGTFAGGLHISKFNSNAIFHYQHQPYISVSLSNNVVTGFMQDHSGNIWIGTDGGGLNLFDIETGRFKHFNSNNTNLTSNAVLSIIEDSRKQIWLGTWDGGLNRFNRKTNSFQSYTTYNSDIPGNDIMVVMEDRTGNLWMGTFQSGLIHYETKTNKFNQYTAENSALSNRMIVDIEEDSEGRLLIATPSGFNIFNPESKQFNVYTHEPGNSKSISANRIYDIFIENDTSIWIGTHNGLNRFNPKTEIFTHYNIKHGLPNNVIKSILFDDSRKLWIATNNGLSRFNTKTGKFKNLTKENGLQSNEFSQRSALKLKDGTILFGGIKGFNVIYPDLIRENLRIPDVLITDFHIYNKPVKIGANGFPLKKHISETEELTLSYKHSVFTFNFAVMDFTIPGKNQYAYMMEGFEKAWNYTGTQNTATYTNLDPGNYLFRVKGSNNDGIWNEQGVSIKITILPPWWQTLWFRISLITIIILLSVGFYLSRVIRLNNQKIYLEKQVKQRTSEVEEKNTILTIQASELNNTNTLLEERQQQIEEQTEELMTQKEELEKANVHLSELNSTKDKFFSIIAHDLKNPFHSILGFSELLNKNYSELSEDEKYMYAELIYQSSKNTYSLLENLLQWARSQTNKIEFRPTNFSISEEVDENINMLQETINKKKISVIHDQKDSYDIYADRDMINTVIRNLLTNAIKFTPAGGEIFVNYLKKNDNIEVSIKDNGIGMSAEEADNLFRVDANISKTGTDGETGTGLGLIICKEFILKNGGTIQVESTPAKGSKFSFTVPAAR